jgi:hypothetical protein
MVWISACYDLRTIHENGLCDVVGVVTGDNFVCTHKGRATIERLSAEHTAESA